MSFAVPPAFAENTVRREGAAGAAWLLSLPRLVNRYLLRWGCEIDGPVRHGQVAVVVPLRRGGLEAVLKLSYPHPGNDNEWHALDLYDGHGAVRILDADPESYAMLLERALPDDLTSLEDDDEVMRVAGEISARLAVPAYDFVPRFSARALEEAEAVAAADERAGVHRLPDDLVSRAVEGLEALAADGTGTMVHGDLHATNVLRAKREPWLAIDVKWLAGSAAWDAATIVRHRLLDLDDTAATIERRLKVFCDTAGVDLGLATAVTAARFVSSYYWEVEHGSSEHVVAAMRAGAELG